MKILQINAVNGIKSTGRSTLEATTYYNEMGHEATVAFSTGFYEEDNYIIGNEFDRKLHGLLSRITGKQAYFSKRETSKLVDFIKDFNPDLVHLSNMHNNYINLNMLLEYLAENDIATVLTLHDCWFYTGKCTHYTVDQCDKWIQGCHNCPRLKKDNPSWFFDRTEEMYHDKKKYFNKIPRLAVVGVSDWITNEARRSFLKDSSIVTRIYNWIDIEVFKNVDTVELRKKMNMENKFVILGVASKWNNSKGLNNFLELANVIPKDTVILLIGNIDRDIILPRNIINIRETHNIEELVNYYSLADVLLNLSLEESFGKVTAESLSCGTPAIVLNSTANPELIGEGCGFVLKNNEIENILYSIDQVKRMRKDNFSESCRKYAKENFMKKSRLDDYLKLYEKLTLKKETHKCL